ncbi:MAG: JAB domain-containing protein [Candidatus Obscuribacter sp.]|nr:JAB domain-containing protein [Candidatus Melainabacteria bacterium]MDX1990111.1 JAB domain-containing protein [Candidatus Obscuribacter sp.]
MLHHLNYKLPVFKLMMVKEEKKQKNPLPSIRSALDAAKLLEPLCFAPEEHFVALHLNSKFEVIGLHEVSHGTLSASLVHPREVFKAALVANSFAILVCHNHPSGAKLSASREDLTTTRTLIDAGKLLGVSVLDHLIVGPQQQSDIVRKKKRESRILPLSIREEHPELWQSDVDCLSA